MLSRILVPSYVVVSPWGVTRPNIRAMWLVMNVTDDDAQTQRSLGTRSDDLVYAIVRIMRACLNVLGYV